jgi:hypothetical protein
MNSLTGNEIESGFCVLVSRLKYYSLLLGRSPTNIQTHHWSKLRESTPRKRLHGMLGSVWHTSTRPR